MKINIIKVNKPHRKEYDNLVSVYRKRLRAQFSITESFLSSRSGESRLESQISCHLKQLNKPYLVVLDERGLQWSSDEFAKKLKSWQESPLIYQVVFLVGGPFGLSQNIKDSSEETWALASGVFTSDLAWLMVWEQIYRAHSINSGTGYHHS